MERMNIINYCLSLRMRFYLTPPQTLRTPRPLALLLSPPDELCSAHRFDACWQLVRASQTADFFFSSFSDCSLVCCGRLSDPTCFTLVHMTDSADVTLHEWMKNLMTELIEFGDTDVLWCRNSHSGHNSRNSDFLLTFYPCTVTPQSTLDTYHTLENRFILTRANQLWQQSVWTDKIDN